jgi:hypothetical protein
MTSSRSSRYGSSATDFLEEAVHLLRRMPPKVLVPYYVGSVPFVAGFLYFWTDMSQSAFAAERHAQAALGVACLFLWMKAWQSAFAGLLHDALTGLSSPRWSVARSLRASCRQGLVQASALFVLPIAFVITLPFGWCFAFYENVAVFGAISDADLRSISHRAARQAQLWPGQNHALLSIIALFGLFVFLNVMIVLFQAPHLLHSLLGIETNLAQSGWHLLNTTLLMTALGISYLCVDPIIKAVYVLRCFHGEAIETGEDLSVTLRRLPNAMVSTTAAVLIFTCCWAAAQEADRPTAERGSASAAASPNQLSPPHLDSSSVAAPELERAIREVITQREYGWRLPRIKIDNEKKPGLLAAFIDSIVETLHTWVREGFRWLRDAVRWILEAIFKRFNPPHPIREPGSGWITYVHILLYALLAGAAGALVFLVLRTWTRRRAKPEEVQAEPVAAVPNLAEEDVLADELPEDGWLKLAQELAERGELRLSLRALYLASLANLGRRQVIRIAKFKSNRDYERELTRRKPGERVLQTAFAELVSTFDWVWYGVGDVNETVLAEFRQQLERVTSC